MADAGIIHISFDFEDIASHQLWIYNGDYLRIFEADCTGFEFMPELFYLFFWQGCGGDDFYDGDMFELSVLVEKGGDDLDEDCFALFTCKQQDEF